MTKKKLAWITDSTAYITDELKNHPDVYVMPLHIIFPDQEYEDGVTLNTEELYRRLNSEKEVPKTSQPPVGKFAELYEKLKEEYEGAIAIHVSGKLSGTIESSRSGAEMADFPLVMVDSKCMSYAITTLIHKGMEMHQEGYSPDDIGTKLNNEASNSKNYILLGNLNQFYKGGRMSGTQFLLGNLLQIKPIIRINTTNGEFELFEKVRSEKKAQKRLLELIKQDDDKNKIPQIQIMHGNVLEKAQSLGADIKNQFPHADIVIGEISSTIAVHAGEGTIAIIWHNEN